MSAGCSTFRLYFDLVCLQPDGTEFQSLVNAMTFNETYFHREEYRLKCLVQSILPEVVKRLDPGDPLKIWSMPCSTGEEPHSIAFYLLKNWSSVDDFNIEIVASDIDTEVLLQRTYARRPPPPGPFGVDEPDFLVVRVAQVCRRVGLSKTLFEQDLTTTPDVLIIDDSSTTRSYYLDVLEAAGFGVDEAINGIEGLEKTMKAPLDLILVDLNMPKMDGHTFLEPLRRSGDWQSVPAIMISTQSREVDRTRANAGGANVYIVKPVDPVELDNLALLLTGQTLSSWKSA